MKKTIVGQTIASTTVDLHGDKLSVEALFDLLRCLPREQPLYQHHDMLLPVCGVMTNFRVEQEPDDLSNGRLVCDLTYDDELVEGTVGGLSISALADLKGHSALTEYHVYLPFPLYQNRALIDSMLGSDEAIAVGKWLQKEVNPLLIALIVFLAKPLWDTIYKETIESQVKRLIDRLKSLWPENTEARCETEVPTCLYQPRPKVTFVPPENKGLEVLVALPDAVEKAKEFCKRDFWKCGKCIKRLHISLDSTSGQYIVLNVEYVDGTHRNFS